MRINDLHLELMSEGVPTDKHIYKLMDAGQESLTGSTLMSEGHPQIGAHLPPNSTQMR